MPRSAPLPPYPGLIVESDETVWDGRFPLQRIRFRQRRFDGTMNASRTWELWRRGRAAALLPYDPVADAVVLIEQFRLPALAAGIDPGDGGNAGRPVRPRRGRRHHAARARPRRNWACRPRRTLPIGDFLLTPGGCDEQVSLHVGEVTAPPRDADGLVGLTGLAVRGRGHPRAGLARRARHRGGAGRAHAQLGHRPSPCCGSPRSGAALRAAWTGPA